MKFESKYDIGQTFILAGMPCVITSITFRKDARPTYELEWKNPFQVTTREMTETQLESSIAINKFAQENADGLKAIDSIKLLLDKFNDAIKKEQNNEPDSQ